jgi:hypothetical protein
MAIVGISLALTNVSHAQGKGGKGGGKGVQGKNDPGKRDYKDKHGKVFAGGHYYEGRDHRHWTRWNWDARHSCYQYWCPSAQCYYYWCAPRNCYYPVTYINEYPPTPVAYAPASPGAPPLPIQVTNINQNAIGNGQNAIGNGAAIGPMGNLLPKGP